MSVEQVFLVYPRKREKDFTSEQDPNRREDAKIEQGKKSPSAKW
jgi:hypothetical protein